MAKINKSVEDQLETNSTTPTIIVNIPDNPENDHQYHRNSPENNYSHKEYSFRTTSSFVKSSSLTINKATESNNQNKTPKPKKPSRNPPPSKAVSKKGRRNSRSDVTAKFFAAMEMSFRQLPKPLQLSLKGELFALVFKYEKQALEEKSLLVRDCTTRTYSNKSSHPAKSNNLITVTL